MRANVHDDALDPALRRERALVDLALALASAADPHAAIDAAARAAVPALADWALVVAADGRTAAEASVAAADPSSAPLARALFEPSCAGIAALAEAAGGKVLRADALGPTGPLARDPDRADALHRLAERGGIRAGALTAAGRLHGFIVLGGGALADS